MTDEQSNPGLPKRRIDLMDPDDVRYWCAAFGCTEDQLARAIAQAGALSGEVHVYLVQQGQAKGG